MFFLKAEEILIGVSESNSGPIKKRDLTNILQCSSGPNNHEFNFESYPNLRGLKYIEEGKIDAYYPIYLKKINRSSSLWPLFIDEILLISNKGIETTFPLSVGIIRGSNTSQLDKKKYQFDFIVNEAPYLFKGLKSKRVNHILIFRTQLPKDLELKNYTVKTVLFQDVGIKISPSFERKLAKEREQIQKDFIKCILKYDFELYPERKELFQKVLEKDIAYIKSMFKEEKTNVKNLIGKERAWIENDKVLKASILQNNFTDRLKSLKTKFPYITEVFIFNHEGAMLSSLHLPSDFDQSDEYKYEVVKSNIEFSAKNISNIYFDESSHSFEVGITIRLEDKKKQFSGGLYIGADINKFFGHYSLK